MVQSMGLAEFIKSAGVRLTAEYTDRNPHMDNSEKMDNWKCRLRCGRSTMTVYFSKGMGHYGSEPTVEEVLDCMASDSAGIENSRTFDDWCGEYGYDTDSRKAERTYKTCCDQADKLKRFLGESAYKTLLWDVERQ